MPRVFGCRLVDGEREDKKKKKIKEPKQKSKKTLYQSKVEFE